MSEMAIDFLMGTALSSVPIYVLTKYYFQNNLTAKDFDFSSVVMCLPFKIGVINVIMIYAVKQIIPEFKNNPVVLGIIMSIILSMLTKTFNEIPEKVIKMDNPNMYHIYSMIIFIVCYYVIVQAKLFIAKN